LDEEIEMYCLIFWKRCHRLIWLFSKGRLNADAVVLRIGSYLFVPSMVYLIVL